MLAVVSEGATGVLSDSEDLSTLSLAELRQRFVTEHEIGLAALRRGDYAGMTTALDREQPLLDEVSRRIDRHKDKR